MEMPEIPVLLLQCHEQGVPVNLQDATLFLSRINSARDAEARNGAVARAPVCLFRRETHAGLVLFLGIPSEQAVEIGVVVDI